MEEIELNRWKRSLNCFIKEIELNKWKRSLNGVDIYLNSFITQPQSFLSNHIHYTTTIDHIYSHSSHNNNRSTTYLLPKPTIN